jgi:hypothetical protein
MTTPETNPESNTDPNSVEADLQLILSNPDRLSPDEIAFIHKMSEHIRPVETSQTPSVDSSIQGEKSPERNTPTLEEVRAQIRIFAGRAPQAGENLRKIDQALHVDEDS